MKKNKYIIPFVQLKILNCFTTFYKYFTRITIRSEN
jgi:hypothetical protein